MKNESILSKLNDLQSFDFSTFRMPTALMFFDGSIYVTVEHIELMRFSDISFNPPLMNSWEMNLFCVLRCIRESTGFKHITKWKKRNQTRCPE